MTPLFRSVSTLLIASFFCIAAPAIAETRKPLLMDGKQTLFQRVLTRPGAALVAKPGAAGGKAVDPFTQYFVYGKASDAGKSWLEVGAGSDGKIAGFVQETDVVPWKHAITVAFSVPNDRQRVLFFKDRDALTTFVNADNALPETQRLVKEFSAKGTLGPNQPVIAAEPEKYIDIQKQFYLLPVLEANSALLKSGARARFVKVASITRDAATTPVAPPAAPAKEAGIANYNAAVVFVIDATSSMQPYIDRARSAMEEVLKQADVVKVQNRIKFGVIAFQDDPAKAKGVEYLTKTFADPNQFTTRENFMAAIKGVTATRSSTRAFAEDSYAGIDDALRKINWQNFGGKHIVFITDASARDGNSPLASTHLSTAQIRTYAQERGVAIWAMHLKTAEGKADHAIAEAQYKQLTAWPGNPPLYFPVEAGDPARLEAQVKEMARQLVEQVRDPGKVLAAPATANGSTIAAAVDSIGRAMVLSYLGRQQGVKSPPMYEAWASDVDVGKGSGKPFTVRVLLTKNQLSDLQTTVRRLADAYGTAQMKPTTLFDQLRSAAVAMGRDPAQLGQGKAKTLEESGLMGEYLDGLPYKSTLMSTDLSTWANIPVGEQQRIIDNLRANAALYQRFHDDVDRWVKLNPSAPDGDAVYPVPFDALP